MSGRRMRVAGASVALVALALGWPAPSARSQTPAEPQPLCEQEGSGGPSSARGAGTLRIATFNVLHTQTDEGEATIDARIPLQVAALRDADVDAVGLQEAINTANHGKVAERLAQGLAAATNQTWHWCWFQSNPHFPGEPDLQPGGGGGPLSEFMASAVKGGEARWTEGVGVLSRYPIERATVRRLTPRSYEAATCVPPDPIGCNAAAFFDSRQVLRARIAAPGSPVDLFTTHLAHGLTPISDATKLAQVVQVLAYIDEAASPDDAPDFLVGDFNSVEGSAVHEAVTGAGFLDTFRAARPADPGNTSDQRILEANSTVTDRIDYVFAKPGACGLRAVTSEVFADEPSPYGGGWLWPSDHYAVASATACTSADGARPAGVPGTGGATAAPEGTRSQELPATGGGVRLGLALAALVAAMVAVASRRLTARAG